MENHKNEKEEKIDNIVDKIFNYIYKGKSIISALISGFICFYFLDQVLSNKITLPKTVSEISLLSIFYIPILMIFFYSIIDIIVSFSQNMSERQINLSDNIKDFLRFFTIEEVLIAIIVLIISGLKDTDISIIILISIMFIMPILLMVIYNLVNYILNTKKQDNTIELKKAKLEETIKNIDMILKIVFFILIIMLLGAAIIYTIINSNYVLTGFYAIWEIVLTIIFIFILKEFKKNKKKKFSCFFMLFS